MKNEALVSLNLRFRDSLFLEQKRMRRIMLSGVSRSSKRFQRHNPHLLHESKLSGKEQTDRQTNKQTNNRSVSRTGNG